jgi:uncharacterized protein (UPF0332 family)
MRDEVKGYLEKAEHALEVAGERLKAGYAPDAATKVYYAMFYAAQALLKSEGINVVKHSAVESALGFHFAKRGRMDQKYHRMLIDARRIRETVDYDLEEEIVEPVASLKVEEGRDFVDTIKRLLGT